MARYQGCAEWRVNVKQFLMIGAAALLAACSPLDEPDYWSATRTGHGVQSAVQAQAPAEEGTDYRAAALADAGYSGAAMRPGLHKTLTGAPWLVAHSAGFQAGGVRQTGQQAAGSALTYMASERKSPYAAKTHLGDAQTRFRIVTVDGSSFAVLFAINMPNKELRAKDSPALRNLTAHAARISGCSVTGAAVAQRDGGLVRRLAAPVRCS